MKQRYRWLIGVCVLLAGAFACNIPDFTVTEQASATPNMTMTALFSSGVLGSLTPPPTLEAVTTATETPTPTPTPTPTEGPPTATPEATGSPTPPPTLTGYPPAGAVRPGGVTTVRYFSNPPTLVGYWTDWIGSEYPVRNVVYGRQNWSGSDDLSVSYRAGWNEKYLFIAVKVIDDIYVQNASGYDIYKGDSIEILLDTDLSGDYYSQQLTSDDFQLGISPGRPEVSEEKEAYLWFPRSRAGAKSEVKIASVKEEGQYRVEAHIPWSVFNVTPANGKRFGFALSVSDNDNPEQNVQQSMVSSASGRRLTDPTTWGELVLTK